VGEPLKRSVRLLRLKWKYEVMRRYSPPFAIALITLILGISAATVWYLKRQVFTPATEEENVVEVVFRHQIEEESKSEGHTIFFLSRPKDTDPSDAFMRRFDGKRGVRKFSQSKKVSDGVNDKETGERGIILDVHRIEWINNSEVKVGVGTYVWSWGQSGSVCRVVRENGKWAVKDCKLTLIT
jgi:hypothetical protein